MIRHLAVAGVILVAASCGSGGDDEAASIEFAVFGEPEEVEAYRDVIAAFEEEQDDVDVSLVVAADRSDLLTRVSTAIAGGSPPDVFLVNYRFYGQFAANGALEPVEDRLEDSDAFAPEDFYPVAMDAFRWDDEQLCMPQNVSSLAVYYNRELFEAAGARGTPRRVDLGRHGRRCPRAHCRHRRRRHRRSARPGCRTGNHPPRPVRLVRRRRGL